MSRDLAVSELSIERQKSHAASALRDYYSSVNGDQHRQKSLCAHSDRPHAITQPAVCHVLLGRRSSNES